MEQSDSLMWMAVALPVAACVIIVLAYWLQFPRGREPRVKGPALALFGGMLSVFPISFFGGWLALITAALPPVPGTLFEAFVQAALLEEVAKASVVALLLRKHTRGPILQLAVFYGILAGSGYAIVENAGYIFYFQDEAEFTSIFRSFTAAPGHAALTGLLGYAIGRARLAGAGAQKVLALGLLTSVSLHGLHNTLWSLLDVWGAIFALPLVAALVGTLQVAVNDAKRRDTAKPKRRRRVVRVRRKLG
jgi:RsiW-degrading membrane proteinase PrsW (M82 family)